MSTVIFITIIGSGHFVINQSGIQSQEPVFNISVAHNYDTITVITGTTGTSPEILSFSWNYFGYQSISLGRITVKDKIILSLDQLLDKSCTLCVGQKSQIRIKCNNPETSLTIIAFDKGTVRGEDNIIQTLVVHAEDQTNISGFRILKYLDINLCGESVLSSFYYKSCMMTGQTKDHANCFLTEITWS